MLTNLKTLINQGIFFSKNFVYKGPEGREPPKVEAAEANKEKNNEGETEKELTTKLEEKQIIKDKLVALLTKYPGRTVNGILKGTTDKSILDYFKDNGTEEQKEAVKDNKTFKEIAYLQLLVKDLSSKSSSQDERQTAWNELLNIAKNTYKESTLQVLINSLGELRVNDLKPIEYLLAENTSCPVATLTKLSNSYSDNIRYLVAKNLSTSQNVLLTLAGDESAAVAAAVALNRNTNLVTIHELAIRGKNDHSKEIVDALRYKLYKSYGINENDGTKVLDFFINHPNVKPAH